MIKICILLSTLLLNFSVQSNSSIPLDKPKMKGALSFEEVLRARRTTRAFSNKTLDMPQVSQLLWAATGTTARRGKYILRTVPSASRLYPVLVYLLVSSGGVSKLDAGLYRYNSEKHSLITVKKGDFSRALENEESVQRWVLGGKVKILIAAEYKAIVSKYGERGKLYSHVEIGHVAQNVFLQAQSLGLIVGMSGGIDSVKVTKALGMPKDHHLQIIMPVAYTIK